VSTPWQDWDAHQWGNALLVHFFRSESDRTAVARLPITADELVRAVSGRIGDKEIIRDSFICAFQCTPQVFRRKLSKHALTGGRWNATETPPFLGYLFFTCFAAASIDKSTVNIGEFRQRLRVLLDHPDGTTYSFGDLPTLWQAFQHWLSERISEGESYRPLRLPNPGWKVRVGYSLALAFPSRDDRLKLAKVLATFQTIETPTVVEVLQLLTEERRHFSTLFVDLLQRAADAFALGVDTDELAALWSAVTEVRGLPLPSDRKKQIQFQLYLEDDELLQTDLALVSSAKTAASQGIHFVQLTEPIGDFSFLVTAGNGLVPRFILDQTFQQYVSAYRESFIARTVSQGVLLFLRNDSSLWQVVFNRPTEGRAKALVSREILEDFHRAYPRTVISSRLSKYPGWFETPSFDAGFLHMLDSAQVHRLNGIRCLQRITPGAMIVFSGGIQIDGAFLGTTHLLPEVNCAGADSVDMFRVDEGHQEQSQFHSQLTKSIDSSNFEFRITEPEIAGTFVLVAKQGETVLTSRRIQFRSRVLEHEYLEPTNPSVLLVEGSLQDVVESGLASDTFLGDSPSLQNNAQLQIQSGFYAIATVDDDERFDRFVEALAAKALRRKGISEFDILEILRGLVLQESDENLWHVLRGWIEAGYVDQFMRRHWRGRVYYALQPRLVVSRASQLRVMLYGLSPFSLRREARTCFAELGAVPLPVRSLSQHVGAPLMWQVESLDLVHVAAKKLGLLEVKFLRSVEQVLPTLAYSQDTLVSLPNYQLQGSWDWERGGFGLQIRYSQPDEVRIEWHKRDNSADLYRVVTDGQIGFESFSRNWALLVGYQLAGRRALQADSKSSLITTAHGPYFPLPVARYLAISEGCLPGPTGRATDYAYLVSEPRVRAWLGAWFGDTTVPQVPRDFHWIASVATKSRVNEHSAILPHDIRVKLRALENVDGARALAQSRLPLWLHPRVRRTLQLLKSQVAKDSND
jgi:hypothetical protein